MEKQYFRYDAKEQLLAVMDANGDDVEWYAYDPAGNILRKTIHGRTTSFTHDKANQLLAKTDPDGQETDFAYDAAGRMVREGAKTYAWGFLDKVLAISEGGNLKHGYSYWSNGQLALARHYGVDVGIADDSDATAKQRSFTASGLANANITADADALTEGIVCTERFLWDGLALIRRDATSFVNEPHLTGGNPILSGGRPILEDMLGNSLGVLDAEDQFTPLSRSAFGHQVDANTNNPDIDFFTGKPFIDGFGYAFLFRNYLPNLGRWKSTDSLGYPDGWNNLLYGLNCPIYGFDPTGGFWSWPGAAIGATLSLTGYLVSSVISGNEITAAGAAGAIVGGAVAGAIAGALAGDPTALTMTAVVTLALGSAAVGTTGQLANNGTHNVVQFVVNTTELGYGEYVGVFHNVATTAALTGMTGAIEPLVGITGDALGGLFSFELGVTTAFLGVANNAANNMINMAQSAGGAYVDQWNQILGELNE